MTQTPPRMKIAILGGSGKEGKGLALRWAHVGHQVTIGSRDAARAQEAAAEINGIIGREGATGTDNASAASGAELVVLAVPYSAQQATVESTRSALSGKILVDVTVPLKPPKVGRVQLPEGGSAVEAVQKLLGPEVRVVSAFQNISAHHLMHVGDEIDCDVLVCADDKDAGETVVALAREIGLGAFYAGPLANSAVAEALTSVLITLNRRYGVTDSGIRITGIPRD